MTPETPLLWQAIADRLRSDIVGGAARPGERLPTEAALAQRFGAHRHTVRRALAALQAEGLVHARRGAGVFVMARPTDYPIGARVRFRQNLAAAGRVAGRRILAQATRAADAAEAQALDLADGARVHVCEGVSLADAEPVALFRSAFPAESLPDLPMHLQAEGSITRALALSGVADYVRATTRITATLADPVQAGHLLTRPGAPLLRTEGLNVGTDGRPVEYGLTWFAADRVALTVGETTQTPVHPRPAGQTPS